MAVYVKGEDGEKIKVAGATGRQGPRGERGPVGPEGPSGPPGDIGPQGDPAGFGEVTASVDDSTGAPDVKVTTSGDNTALNIEFEFSGLKGERGEIGPPGAKGDTGEGIPDGGEPGQVLTKTDNGTEWNTLTAESVGAISNTTVKSISIGSEAPSTLADGEVFFVYE